jgi:hypothetical protein
MKKNKILTVIVPSFNQGKYINNNLKILEQFINIINVIIIDGGSRDETLEILGNYKKFLVIYGVDKNQVNALNIALEYVNTEWVCWQNSDDLYNEKNLENILVNLEVENSDIVIGNLGVVDKDGLFLYEVKVTPPSYAVTKYEQEIPFFNQACFWRTQISKKLIKFDERYQYVFDVDYFWRMLRITNNIKIIDKIIGYLRLHEETKTSNGQIFFKKEKINLFGIKNYYFKIYKIKINKLIYHIKNKNTSYIIKKLIIKR